VIAGLFVAAFFIAKCDLPHTEEHPKRLRLLGLAAFANSRRHITNRLVALANAKLTNILLDLVSKSCHIVKRATKKPWSTAT
jgi:hypothetical protein